MLGAASNCDQCQRVPQVNNASLITKQVYRPVAAYKKPMLVVVPHTLRENTVTDIHSVLSSGWYPVRIIYRKNKKQSIYSSKKATFATTSASPWP